MKKCVFFYLLMISTDASINAFRKFRSSKCDNFQTKNVFSCKKCCRKKLRYDLQLIAIIHFNRNIFCHQLNCRIAPIACTIYNLEVLHFYYCCSTLVRQLDIMSNIVARKFQDVFKFVSLANWQCACAGLMIERTLVRDAAWWLEPRVVPVNHCDRFNFRCGGFE
jgi:hypothetical protein